jgi:hypothetical protein
MSVETSTPRSRRAVLAAALGGLGAVIASRIATPDTARAADTDPVLVGGSFTGNTATTITTAGTANAIVGHSADGVGLWGASDDATPVADFTVPGHRTGVVGLTGTGAGVASNTGETGVYGFSNLSFRSNGVWGDSTQGTGVFGTGDTGVWGIGYWGTYGQGRIAVMGDASSAETGVYGYSGDVAAPIPPPAGVGVQATAGSVAQVALNVTGKAKFSRSGRTAIARGRSARKIVMPGVTASSYIIATLQTRRAGVYVHAVVPAAGSFTIYLNKNVTAATVVGYLVIN